MAILNRITLLCAKIRYLCAFLFFLTISQIPCFLSLIVTIPLKKLFGFKKPFRLSRKLFHLGFKWTNELFFNIVFAKKSSIDKNKRYVYMANHSTFIDPIITATLNHVPVSISIGYAKFVPFMGWNMWLMNIPFVPDVPRDKSVPSGITDMYSKFLNDADNSDLVLTIFPTGKRIFVKDDIILDDLRSGGFVIAKNIKCNIVPVYHNFIDVFDDKKKTLKLNTKVYCLMGTPIKIKDRTIEELKLLYHNAQLKLKGHMEKILKEDNKN